MNLPTLDDSTIKKMALGVIRANPRKSPKQVSRLFEETVGVPRLKKILVSVATWNRGAWKIVRNGNGKPPKPPIPAAVKAVLCDLKAGKTPLDIALERNVEFAMVLGVKQGRYDGLVQRNSKRWVKCNGVLKLYDEKGYEPSGKSIKGALEVDDNCDELKCHECGDWFENLADHIHKDHHITAREYKLRHGLKFTAALVGERTRLRRIIAGVQGYKKTNGANILKARKRLAALRKAGHTHHTRPTTAGLRNVRGTCSAQLMNDLKLLADKLGHVPSASEIENARINRGAIYKRFGSVEAALKSAGMNLPKKSPMRFYSDEALLSMVRAFYARHKRPPGRSDLRRGLLPNVGTFQKRFGSWSKALRLAGVSAKPRWKRLRKNGVPASLSQVVPLPLVRNSL